MDLRKDLTSAATELRSNVTAFARSVKQSPLTSDNLAKVQEDRHFLENVMSMSYKELLEKGTYESLTSSVSAEQNKKKELHSIVHK